MLILPRATVNAHFVLNAFLKAKGLLALVPRASSLPPGHAQQAGMSSTSHVSHWSVFRVPRFALLPVSRKVALVLGGKQLLLLPRGVREVQAAWHGTLLSSRGAWLKLIPCVLS